jgi:hypothetical protein
VGDNRQRGSAWLREGIRGGLIVGIAVVILAVLGLTPALSWIPEGPLVTLAILVPVLAYGLIGYRVRTQTGRIAAASAAGAVAGAISGAVGGVAYALFGKPVLNIAVGLLLGAIGGAIIGAAGGLRRTSP